jgi:Fe-S cluster assembly protein SufD
MDIFVKSSESVDYFMPSGGGIINVYLGQGSRLRFYTFNLGGRSVINNLNIEFRGKNAKAELYGLYLSETGQSIENNTFLRHAAPSGESFQQYHGILSGKGRAIFNGRVLVARKAQKTNAFLENKNILLGRECQMLSRPFLEIFADDVRCTHAFSSSQIEDDEILYLASRGITKEKAKKILLLGFAQKIINRVEDKTIKAELCAKISPFLSEK